MAELYSYGWPNVMAILSQSVFQDMFGLARIEQLASDFDPDNGTVSVDTGKVTQALSSAEGLINNNLSLQYSVAEIEADAGVIRMCGDVAYYYLESRRGTPPVEVINAYNLALQQIQALRDGTAKLAVVDQLLPSHTLIDPDNVPDNVPTEATDSGFFD